MNRRTFFQCLLGALGLGAFVKPALTESSPFGRCEVCGEPATVGVMDTKELPPVIDEHGTRWATSEPNGIHWFCVAHQRPSRETRCGYLFMTLPVTIVPGQPWTVHIYSRNGTES